MEIITLLSESQAATRKLWSPNATFSGAYFLGNRQGEREEEKEITCPAVKTLRL